MSVKKLIFISDTPGITDVNGEILHEINVTSAAKMLNDEGDNAGVTSSLRSALMALENNAEMVHIINGKIPHVLMRELFTDELVGTSIKSNI